MAVRQRTSQHDTLPYSKARRGSDDAKEGEDDSTSRYLWFACAVCVLIFLYLRTTREQAPTSSPGEGMLRGMYPGGDNKAGGDMVVDTSRGGWGGASLGPAVPVMAQPGPGDPIPGFNPLPVLDDAAANPLPVLEAVAANPVLVVEAGAVVAPAPSPSPKPLTPEEVLFASRADESLDVEAPLDKPRDLADKIKKAAARRAKNHMAWHDNVPATGLYALVAADTEGMTQPLSQYRGKVSIVVNVASKCGFTDANYKGLQALYEKYQAQGLEVLAFPCNQFGNQEPESDRAIRAFAAANYHATFPIFAKTDVNGANAHPVYQFLRRALGTEQLTWNFVKILVDRSGKPRQVFGSAYDAAEVEAAVLALLNEAAPQPKAPALAAGTPATNDGGAGNAPAGPAFTDVTSHVVPEDAAPALPARANANGLPAKMKAAKKA